MKSWLPFFVVLTILFVVGYATSSWAAFALVVLCLIVYYIRYYRREILQKKRELNRLKKEMANQQSTDASQDIQ